MIRWAVSRPAIVWAITFTVLLGGVELKEKIADWIVN